MTDKELRKLSRAELLEMLIAEMEENEALRNKLTKVSKKLSERTVKSDEPGSMAEIAMKMTGVFKSADEAAALYLNSIKEMTEEQKDICWKMAEDAKAESKAMKEESNRVLNEALESESRAKNLEEENKEKKQSILELENTLKEKISKAEKVTLLAESKLEEFISKISEKRDAEEKDDSEPEKKTNRHKRVTSNKDIPSNEQKSSETEDNSEKEESTLDQNNEKVPEVKNGRRKKARTS